jgi:RecA/RadA recombinase
MTDFPMGLYSDKPRSPSSNLVAETLAALRARPHVLLYLEHIGLALLGCKRVPSTWSALAVTASYFVKDVARVPDLDRLQDWILLSRKYILALHTTMQGGPRLEYHGASTAACAYDFVESLVDVPPDSPHFVLLLAVDPGSWAERLSEFRTRHELARVWPKHPALEDLDSKFGSELKLEAFGQLVVTFLAHHIMESDRRLPTLGYDGPGDFLEQLVLEFAMVKPPRMSRRRPDDRLPRALRIVLEQETTWKLHPANSTVSLPHSPLLPARGAWFPKPLSVTFGRDADVHTVRETLKGGGAVVIQGEAGMGKTTVALEVCAKALLDGSRVVFTSTKRYRNSEGETLCSRLVSLEQVAKQLLHDLDRELGYHAEPDSDGGSLGDALQRRLAHAQADPFFTRLLIVLDGLDASTVPSFALRQLRSLVRAVESSGAGALLLVGREKLSQTLGEAEIHHQVIEVVGLDCDQFNSLAADRGLELEPEQARELHRRSAGKPVVVEALSREPWDLFALPTSGQADSPLEAGYEHRVRVIVEGEPRHKRSRVKRRLSQHLLNVLALLHEPPDITRLFFLSKSYATPCGVHTASDLWAFMTEVQLSSLLANDEVQRGELPRGPLKLYHMSLAEYVDRQLRDSQRDALHEAFSLLLGDCAGFWSARRGRLYHLARAGCRPNGLTYRLVRFPWAPLFWDYIEDSLFPLGQVVESLDLIWKKLDPRQRARVREHIEQGMEQVLREARRDCVRSRCLLELSTELALAKGPFLSQLDPELLASDQRDGHVTSFLKLTLRDLRIREVRPSEITLAIDVWAGYFPLWAAQPELGQAGVLLALNPNPWWRLQQLLAGQVDLIGISLSTILGRPPKELSRLKVVGVVSRSRGADKILINRKKFPANAGRLPASLHGARWFEESACTNDFFLRHFLAEKGFSPESLRTVSRGQNLDGMFRAVKEGSVDLVATWEPHASELLQVPGSDFEQIYSSAEGDPVLFDVLVMLEEHTETWRLRRGLRAIAEEYRQPFEERMRAPSVVEQVCDRLQFDETSYIQQLDGVTLIDLQAMGPFFGFGSESSQESLLDISKRIAPRRGGSESQYAEVLEEVLEPRGASLVQLSAPVVPRSSIRQGGDHCMLIFRGQEHRLRRSKSTDLLVQLLGHPYERYEVLELGALYWPNENGPATDLAMHKSLLLSAWNDFDRSEDLKHARRTRELLKNESSPKNPPIRWGSAERMGRVHHSLSRVFRRTVDIEIRPADKKLAAYLDDTVIRSLLGWTFDPPPEDRWAVG